MLTYLYRALVKKNLLLWTAAENFSVSIQEKKHIKKLQTYSYYTYARTLYNQINLSVYKNGQVCHSKSGETTPTKLTN